MDYTNHFRLIGLISHDFPIGFMPTDHAFRLALNTLGELFKYNTEVVASLTDAHGTKKTRFVFSNEIAPKLRETLDYLYKRMEERGVSSAVMHVLVFTEHPAGQVKEYGLIDLDPLRVSIEGSMVEFPHLSTVSDMATKRLAQQVLSHHHESGML